MIFLEIFKMRTQEENSSALLEISDLFTEDVNGLLTMAVLSPYLSKC